MILAPCPVGFWRRSALIRQILLPQYFIAFQALQQAACVRDDTTSCRVIRMPLGTALARWILVCRAKQACRAGYQGEEASQ